MYRSRAGGEGVKTIIKKATRDEKGAALALALVLLVVGGLILTPLLGLMSTGLMAGQVYERKTDELYAADAGVEDAIWKIQSNNLTFDPTTNSSAPWYLTVNDRRVEVRVYRHDWNPQVCVENLTYQVFSTAATDDGSDTASIVNSTAIDAHLVVSYLDFSSLLDYAIVSNSTVDIGPNNYVDGAVWLPSVGDMTITPTSTPCDEVIEGCNVIDKSRVSITWPTFAQLSPYYRELVEGADDPGDTIQIQYRDTLGPCYREGELNVSNMGDPDTLVLEGTVYVHGNLEFEQPGTGHEYKIDLNGHTIFADGYIKFPSAGGQQKISILGSGCVIAVDYVDFYPSIVSTGDEFVLVMSITDEVQFQPGGNFTGCIAGSANVELQPGNDITWIPWRDKGLDFPTGAGNSSKLPPVTGIQILSWDIDPP